MRLFYFVQEHDAVGASSDRFGQLSAFFISYIAWRSAYQARYGVTFHVFRHIEADQSIFVVEQKFRQCLSQFGLSDSCWTEKQEGPHGPSGIG